MRYYDILLERHPDEMVMYHGTYAAAAKRIAKKGIIAKPAARNYAENDPSNYHIASLDGAYFTNTLSVAVGYAYKAAHERGDWCAVITAMVPLTQAVPDEDVVTRAMRQAERQTRDPDAFVRAFHRNLVQDRPIPMRPDLMVKVRDAFANLEDVEDEEGLIANVRRYRRALDHMTRAYADMVFDTHPVYLGGNHTMRLPRGLPAKNILAITQFDISFPKEDDGGDYPPDYPHVGDVSVMLGQPFTRMQLQDAVDDLQQQDFF
jgi:hypothetical protein